MKSKKGYWIGAGLIVVAVLGAVAWFVVSLVSVGDQVDGFQRVRVPGEGTVQLDAQKYVVYFEGANADEVVPSFEVAIIDPETDTPLDIEPYAGSLTYSFGEEGSAVGTVTPARAGDYAVRTEGGEGTAGARVAFGDSIAGEILRAILGGFAIGGLLAFAGVILIVVTAIRRRRDTPVPPL